MTAYWCEHAWLGPRRIVEGVLVDVTGTKIARVTEGVPAPAEAFRLAGLTIPGLANCHSHAFHRALRGRTQLERGSFWTWRDTMYGIAERLDPDHAYELARAAYEEMVSTGITAVGEFHYLHHAAGGAPYEEPNAMGLAMVAAARDAGLRITLLDACYLSSGFGAPPDGVQRRFSDGTAEAWAQRVGDLASHPDTKPDDVTVGTAIHSVRAVPRDDLSTVVRTLPDAPLHVHLSEQVAENQGCVAAYGLTPAMLLAEHGAVTARLSAVHATHLSADDLAVLAAARSFACLCPTTERDLADGIGPAPDLAQAGARLTLGSDSHAVIDLFEEMRAVELDARLATQQRGHLTAAELLGAATQAGHASLGLDDAGQITAGNWADLVTLDLRSPRTAGAGTTEETAVFAASAADVLHVVASGRRIELDPGDVGARLDRVITSLLEQP